MDGKTVNYLQKFVFVLFFLQKYNEGPCKAVKIGPEGGSVFPIDYNPNKATKYAVYSVNLATERDQYYNVYLNRNTDSLQCSRTAHTSHYHCDHRNAVARKLLEFGTDLRFNRKLKRAEAKRQIWTIDEGLADDIPDMSDYKGVCDCIPNPRFMQTANDDQLSISEHQIQQLTKKYNEYRYNAPNCGEVAHLWLSMHVCFAILYICFIFIMYTGRHPARIAMRVGMHPITRNLFIKQQTQCYTFKPINVMQRFMI